MSTIGSLDIRGSLFCCLFTEKNCRVGFHKDKRMEDFPDCYFPYV
jgi:hypothetical protein